jgi:hydroxyethylthiazole kinase
MSRITGSGCMLSAVLGAFCGASSDSGATVSASSASRGKIARGFFQQTVAGVCAMGIAGEYAAAACPDGRTGSFRVSLIDGLSLVDSVRLRERMKIGNIPL